MIDIIWQFLKYPQCPLVFLQIKCYIIDMDIQSVSVDMSQAQVQEQAAVQATELDTAKQQAQTEPVPADPNLGQNVDLTV